MSDHDFHQLVLDRLADLKAEQAATTEAVRNIVARLDKLNGSVARHEQELAERRGAEKATAKWSTHLIPIVRYAAGVVLAAVAVLALNHSSLFSLPK